MLKIANDVTDVTLLAVQQRQPPKSSPCVRQSVVLTSCDRLCWLLHEKLEDILT